jgi:hypothetical protein
MTTSPRPPRPIKGPLISVEGTILLAPIEHHTNSLWRVLQTDAGLQVRFILSLDGELTRWVEVGQRVRVQGHVLSKRWMDGPHPTVSAHHAVEILDMPARQAAED